MTIVELPAACCALGAHPSASRLKIWPARANRDASRAANGAESRSAKVFRWCAARLPLRLLTEDFDFHKILGTVAFGLPIQIDGHWRDNTASTPLPPLSDWLAVTKAQD